MSNSTYTILKAATTILKSVGCSLFFLKIYISFHSIPNIDIFGILFFLLERDHLDRTLNFFDINNTEITLIIPSDRNLFETLDITATPIYVVVNSSSETIYYGNVKNLEKFLKSDKG